MSAHVQYKRDEIANIVAVKTHRGVLGRVTRLKIPCLYEYKKLGRTGHDFDNHYDDKTRTLIWFEAVQPSGQQLFQKLMSGELKPLFFARWSQGDPFTFLGTGTIISFEDGS